MELVGLDAFIKKNENNTEEVLKTEIHNNFEKTFHDDEVVSNFNNPKKLNNKRVDYLIYNNPLSVNGLEYNIFKIEEGLHNWNNRIEGRIFDFVISKGIKRIDLLGLRFVEEEVGGEECLNLIHRRIESRIKEEIGISGSEFLQKAEDYLALLKKNNLLSVDKIKAEISQFSVLSWLIKNNFGFSGKNYEEVLNCFKNENGELSRDNNGRIILNDDYMLIPFEDRKHGGTKDEYIIKKKFVNNPEYEDLRNKYYKDGEGENLGKKVLILDSTNNIDRGGNVVHDLVERGIMPRFVLEKEIK